MPADSRAKFAVTSKDLREAEWIILLHAALLDKFLISDLMHDSS